MASARFQLTFDYPESARHAAPVLRRSLWGWPGFEVSPGDGPGRLVVSGGASGSLPHLRRMLSAMCYAAKIEEQPR